ncbi:MAG: hypothetical protein HP494_02135 [Nitrospira sp.]|nr:hypothetical protein [Nitrospira sp.]
MWILGIILLAAPIGVSPVTVLNTFTTYEDCKPERDRVGFAMAESYPHENTFRIVCQFQDQQPATQAIHHEQEAQHPVTLLPTQLVAGRQIITLTVQ